MQSNLNLDLSQESLSDAEVHELLRRLSVEQFEAPKATLGDVAEATNVEVDTLARILAEIRQITYQDLIGNRLDHHETLLNEHERKLKRLGRLADPVSAYSFDAGVRRESFFAIAVFVAALVIAAVYMGFFKQSPVSVEPPPFPTHVEIGGRAP